MAITLNDKAERMVRFLIGLRHPQVLAALRRYGFSERDLDEGWALLRRVAPVSFDQEPRGAPESDPLELLDEWENKWFVVAQAVLERHHPDLARVVFRSVGRTSGLTLVLTVGLVLERLRDLRDGKHGDEGRAAWKILTSRGLTAAVCSQAELQLEHLRTLKSSDPNLGRLSRESAKRAEDAMWAWYREWTQIVRLELHDGRLLRGLRLTATSKKRPAK